MTDLLHWMIVIASLVGVVLNIHRLRACFAIWLITNTAWCIVDVSHGLYSQATLQAVYAGLSVYGLIQWGRETHE
jgi:nicotinamide riboside transporter PnuC